MSASCKYEAGCKVLADDSGWCPRHSAMISHAGSEKAFMDKELGPECQSCYERIPSGLLDCPDCGQENVCAECVSVGYCCEGEFLDDYYDDNEDDTMKDGYA